MTYRTLTFLTSGSVACIELGGPDYRGFTNQLAGELDDLCAEIALNDKIRVVILTFDGGNLQSIEDGGNEEFAGPDNSPFVGPVAKLKQPVICAIRGDGIGLGLELAMACDIRLGTEGSRFGLPQIQEGTIPFAGGTQRLPRLVGRGKALEMVLTGELIDGAEALRIGLVNRILPSDHLEEGAFLLGKEMAEKSPLAASFVKEALYSGMDLTLDQGLRMELDLYLLLFTTEDRVEGVTAFKDKRKPAFKGE
jgi:enoyl-CoA hydratase/carnithine racemase